MVGHRVLPECAQGHWLRQSGGCSKCAVTPKDTHSLVTLLAQRLPGRQSLGGAWLLYGLPLLRHLASGICAGPSWQHSRVDLQVARPASHVSTMHCHHHCPMKGHGFLPGLHCMRG